MLLLCGLSASSIPRPVLPEAEKFIAENAREYFSNTEQLNS